MGFDELLEESLLLLGLFEGSFEFEVGFSFFLMNLDFGHRLQKFNRFH